MNQKDRLMEKLREARGNIDRTEIIVEVLIDIRDMLVRLAEEAHFSNNKKS